MIVRRMLMPVAVALALIAPIASFAQPGPAAPPATAPLTKLDAPTKEALMKKISELVTTSAFVPGVDFDQWDALIEKHKGAIDGAETPEAFTGAVNRALREFKFSHIVLMSPRSTQARVTRQTVGLGVSIVPHKDGLLVTRTVKGAPAEVGGLTPGDVILTVDGAKATGPEQLRGEEGTKVQLVVQREDGEKKDVALERRKFDTTVPEEISWPTMDTAVLKVPTFDLSYNSRRVEELIDQAKKQNAKNLVLDLRGNGGGAVMNVLHLLGQVMPRSSEIGTFIRRGDARRWVEKGGDVNDLKGIADSVQNKLKPSARGTTVPFPGKVAVLIDRGSGSASEIAAAAIRDVLGGPVIGTRSAGAVLASVITQVGNGFSLQYPIFDYVTIKGLRLEGAGVAPDQEAPTPLFLRKGEKDPGVVAVLDVLTKSGQR